MIPFAAIPVAAQAIGGIAQLFGGAKKRRKAEQAYRNTENYANQTLDTIKSQADIGLPSEQYIQAQQNIDRNQSGGIRGLQALGGGNALKGIQNLVQSGMNANANLDVQNAMVRNQNRQRKLSQILGQRGMIQNMKMGKYQGLAQAAQGETGAGLQNIFGALSSGSQLLGGGIGGGGGGLGSKIKFNSGMMNSFDGVEPANI